MITPEGAVKKKVREWLKNFNVYCFSPVQTGMGKPTLDDLCCFRGKFLAIEYKAEGKIPTPRQRLTMDEIRRAGGIAIWGDSADNIIEQIKMAFGLP